MFEAKTEVVQLESRLGRVGSIQAWDPWESRKSVKHAKWWVSKIARLSHGLGEAEDFEAHFDRVVNQLKHESVLEFVPFRSDANPSTLPGMSLRSRGIEWLAPRLFVPAIAELQSRERPAPAFLVEAPIFVARQWMRHRSFAYLEMSRRYTKGSRAAWEFYGEDLEQTTWPVPGKRWMHDPYGGTTDAGAFWGICESEYRRRLDAGWPNEIARGCMPVETMTKFWVAGFDRDWEAFLRLRDDDHAQPEIQVFARFIRTYIESKKELPHV